MQRVSSRQRLVSWDAFDATTAADHAEATSSSSEEEQEDYSISAPQTMAMTMTMTMASRKRERPTKQKSPLSTSTRTSPRTSSPSSGVLLNSIAMPVNVPAFPWEIVSSLQQLHPPMDELPDDVYLYMCSFLDLHSISRIMSVNHKFRHLLLSADCFWMTKCRTLWDGLMPLSHGVSMVDSTNLPTTATGPNCKMPANLPLLISMTPANLPTKVDETMLGTYRRVRSTSSRTLRTVEQRRRQAEQEESELIVTTNCQNNKRSIQYTGRVGSGDRCIRSNHPLPRPSRRRQSTASAIQNRFSLHKQHGKHPSFFDMLCRGGSSSNAIHGTALDVWRPFVAPFQSISTSKDGERKTLLEVGPRMMAYFEVSILESADTTRGNSVRRDCVAVGVATESFSCQTRMPGWDNSSFGYHGDDGGTFHASGAMLERFGPCFGTGDTVGCGIDYVARGIFFTLNGSFLGYGWKQIDSEFLENNLYGVVGIDTNDPVSVNYGDSPFQFDLGDFASKHDKLIAHQYQHQNHHAAKQVVVEDSSSELADLPSYPEI